MLTRIVFRYIIFLLIAVVSDKLGLIWLCDANRLYVHQFPPEADHLELPRITLYSHYMGKMKYPHVPLLLESMRWNPKVDFHIINIIPTGSDMAADLTSLVKRMAVPNVYLRVIEMHEWRQRVKDRLGLDLDWDMSWSYKLCDYKPALAHLFPEMAGPEYKYWGFVDLDVVWGNFTRFSSWFQGQPFVITGTDAALLQASSSYRLLTLEPSLGWWRSTGAGQFFINEEWTRE
jgi:hypothetical protein